MSDYVNDMPATPQRREPQRAWAGFPMHSPGRRAFTLTELVVIAILICMLVMIVCGVLAGSRARDDRVRCAANLRSIGQAISLYANDNRGMYPRTQYVVGNPPAFSNNTGPNSMSLTNDVNGALFMLIKFADANPEQFVCPSTDQEADSMGHQPAMSRNSFSDWKKNLSYSYANPYPDTTAANNNYRMPDSHWQSAARPVAADANPGGPALAALKPTDDPAALRQGNSRNHKREGQFVLFGDGSARWCDNSFAGVNKDNIYRARGSTQFQPLDWTDSILLPIFNRPEKAGTPYVAIAAGIGLVVVAGVVILIVVLTRRKKKAPASCP